MATYRAQISFQLDSALPRDAVTINPHFEGDNPSALADALKSNLLAAADIGPTFPFTIKMYDAKKPPPSFPLATVTNGTGFKASNIPRELAMCLSYYCGANRPRYRGRLYIPVFLLGGTAIGLRPSATQISKTLAFRTILSSGLPPASGPVLWSPTDQRSSGITSWWVDDEWDIVRSRGLRSTTRQIA